MKVLSVNNSPAFQKKLVAKGGIVNGVNSDECYIYRLEADKDKDYFKNLQKDFPEWADARFTNVYMGYFCKDEYIDRTYVMENSENLPLGYFMAQGTSKDGIKFDLIETLPKNSDNSYRYIGETMISFLAKKAQTENKQHVSATCIVNSAKPFYLKNYFELIYDKQYMCSDAYLYKKDYDSVIEKNEFHTGKSIELIG